MVERRVLKTLLLASVMALGGCLAQSPEHTAARVVHGRTVAATPAASPSVPIQRPSPSFSPSPAPHDFSDVVTRLQDLGYLPLVHAHIHGKDRNIRHDAWLWPVSTALQNAADEYPWNAGNPFIRGAVIQFERANGILGPKGVSEGKLHKTVMQALSEKHANPDPWPYEWVYVTKANGTRQPEQLHVWEHGKGWIWHTVVNTGVLGSTQDGTWPIYQRLPKTTMRGVFPQPISWASYHALAGQRVPQWAGSSLMQPARGTVGGSPVRWVPYNDPGILWVNYFDDGRGIHYYPRAAYGFPQSAGCVEEPYHAAPVTYRLLHYGVPVTVSGALFGLAIPTHGTQAKKN